MCIKEAYVSRNESKFCSLWSRNILCVQYYCAIDIFIIRMIFDYIIYYYYIDVLGNGEMHCYKVVVTASQVIYYVYVTLL